MIIDPVGISIVVPDPKAAQEDEFFNFNSSVKLL
jgi:hypothetical protein